PGRRGHQPTPGCPQSGFSTESRALRPGASPTTCPTDCRVDQPAARAGGERVGATLIYAGRCLKVVDKFRYAAGPRVSEVARLKASEIARSCGFIWVRAGKGRKAPKPLLPPNLLELLQIYFRGKPPKECLSPGAHPDQPIPTKPFFLP